MTSSCLNHFGVVEKWEAGVFRRELDTRNPVRSISGTFEKAAYLSASTRKQCKVDETSLISIVILLIEVREAEVDSEANSGGYGWRNLPNMQH